MTCIRIGNHRHGQGAACGRLNRHAAFLPHFVDLHHDFSYLGTHVFLLRRFSAIRSIG